jgi:hypothetical protein
MLRAAGATSVNLAGIVKPACGIVIAAEWQVHLQEIDRGFALSSDC